MAHENNPALTPKELVINLAIASHIDAQAKIAAQTLHKNPATYYSYAIVDALTSSYSMFKYFFDMFINGNSDDMHDLMMTPEAIVAITIEALFLLVFSSLAYHFDREKKEEKERKSDRDLNDEKGKEDGVKEWIIMAWPYFRDILKGLKNAFKGWRNLTLLTSALGLADISLFLMPVGLGLGILGAANRFLLRSIVEHRKMQMGKNADLLLTIKNLTSLINEHRKIHNEQIEYQSAESRFLGFLGATTAGFIDGLYLYVGIITLGVLSPPLLAAMSAVCIFYTLASIVTRIYEEYDYQLRLLITQSKCKLVLISKEMSTSYGRLLFLQEKNNKDEDDEKEINSLKKEIALLIDEFEEQRRLLQRQTSTNYWSASLLGLRNGLYAYGALSSVVFFVSAILFLAGVSFPPALILITVFSGLVIILGFLIHSWWFNYQQTKSQETKSESSFTKLLSIKNHMQANDMDASCLSAIEFNKAVNDCLSFFSSSPSYVQEWFEVVRSLFSGFVKGLKFFEFAGNMFMEQGVDGHYSDPPIMLALAAINGLLFGFILGGRAMAKGIGRIPLGHVDRLTSDEEEPLTVKKEEPLHSKQEMEDPVIEETNSTPSTIHQPPQSSTNSFSHARSFPNLTMFQPNPEPLSLDQTTTPESTAPGLS